jgi:hypothetical protein
MSAPPVYNIECAARNCILEIVINGLKVARKNAAKGLSFTYPFDTEVIGKGNQIVVRAYPTLAEDGMITTFEDVWISGAIKQYVPDDVSGPENGKIIHVINFDIVKQQREKDAGIIPNLTALFPISETYTFDNDDGLSFKNRLVDAPAIKDEKIILEYARHLRDLIRQRSTNELFEEYKVKLQDYDIAYPGEAEPDNFEWFKNLMEKKYYPSGPVDDFKDEELLLVPWCDGRVWELALKPDRAFFCTRGQNGRKLKIEAYVGAIDKKLCIIR